MRTARANGNSVTALTKQFSVHRGTGGKAGRSTIMIAADATTVGMLGARTQADRIATGEVTTDGVRLHDGNRAGTGDDIITRLNDRRLVAGVGWVKNGDRWCALRRFDDGSLAVRRLARGEKIGGSVVLPARSSTATGPPVSSSTSP